MLANAAELGIPLVPNGKDRTVKLVREPADVGADLVADGGGLWMTPYVRAGRALVPLGSCLLIGDPPHGLAWWRDGEPELAMAPFSRPLGKAESAACSGAVALATPRRLAPAIPATRCARGREGR
ncbi:MAG: hypothetical protein ACRDYY_07480 [Acidimicrobiales bacterium]